MKKNSTTVLLMLLVFLIVVAAVTVFLTRLDRSSVRVNPYDTAASVADPAVTFEVPSPESSIEAADAETPATVFATTSAAETVPTPTAAIEENPARLSDRNPNPADPRPTTVSSDRSSASAPVGTNIGRGSFRSDTGTALNIQADWSAVVSGKDSAYITVTVYADCYSLYTTATPGALRIALGGQYASLAYPDIARDNTRETGSIEINSGTFTVPLASLEHHEIPLDVAWQFRGSYSGVSLDTIGCSGNLVLSC